MLTEEERREQASQTREYLAEHFHADVTDEDSAAMGKRLREAFAGLRKDSAA
ncbi:hypothetical protein [Streptomyces sp. NPDC001774]